MSRTIKKENEVSNTSSGSGNAATLARRGGGGGEMSEALAGAGAGLDDDSIAVGPSLIFENGGVAESPQPSQLTQTQSLLPRQRPRFRTVQDLDVALNQAIEGKITSKNAWASKEASDLLEGITHTIESTLQTNTTDDYSGFAKAATVVEGCSKVWVSRVDSTYLRSNQMVQRLLRNDEGAQGGRGDGDGEGEEGSEEAGTDGDKKKGRANRPVTLARTLAVDAAEINLDSKAKTSLTQTGMNAQFRAITEKFDQGNAQGLLMSNTPLGRAGNLVLDIDYAEVQNKEFSMRRMKKKKQQQVRHSGEQHGEDSDGEKEEEEEGESVRESLRPSALIRAQYREEDEAIGSQLTDLPSRLPETESQRASGRPSTVAPLLVLLHAAMKEELIAEASGRSRHGSRANSPTRDTNGSGNSAGLLSLPDGANRQTYDDDDNDNDNDMGGGGWDDGYDDEDDNNYGSKADSRHNANEEQRQGRKDEMEDEGGEEGSAADIGALARRLVTGEAEMRTMDSLFSTGGARLALEADDPSGWCPLQPTGARGILSAHSELNKLHKEHRMAASQVGGAAGAGAGAPAAKRAKKERTVVFQLPGEGGGNSEKQDGSNGGVFQADAAAPGSPTGMGALKQCATKLSFTTPLGKEIMLGKDAASAVVQYVQSGVQRQKAREAGLLLPDPPVPGETIPAYLPYPVKIDSYFQPFSTPLPEWNLLRKSANGALLMGTSGNKSSVANARGETAVDGLEAEEAEMPAQFYAGGADAGYDDDDDVYGPDDNDSNDHYPNGGAVDPFSHDYQHNLLLANMDAIAQQQMQLQQLTAESAAPSARASGVVRLSEPAELIRALQSSEAMMPSQIDVVSLRDTMWAALKSTLEGSEGALLLDGTHRQNTSSGGGGVTDENRRPDAETAHQLLKGHARRAVERAQQKKDQQTLLGQKRARDEEEEEEEEEEGATPRRTPIDPSTSTPVTPVTAPRFADVVKRVLPRVPTLSSTGTLSPAFFFFSMLFIANEHNVLLDNVETLDDLIVRGVAGAVAAH